MDEKLKELKALIGMLEARNENIIEKADAVSKGLAPFCRQWNDTQVVVTTAMSARVVLRCMRDVIAEMRGEQ